MKNENGHTFIRNEDLQRTIMEQSQAMFHYRTIKMGEICTYRFNVRLVVATLSESFRTDFYDWVDYLRSLYMLESGCAPQDYNEMTEIGLMFTLLPIIAVINVLIMLMCQTKTQEQKTWNLKRQRQWNLGRRESRWYFHQTVCTGNDWLLADKRMAREDEVKKWKCLSRWETGGGDLHMLEHSTIFIIHSSIASYN